MKIILATTSPYRIEAFKFLGIPFEAKGSNVDESQLDRNNPEDLVKKLSAMKAESVARNSSDIIAIGMDSVGCFNGRILKKPKTKEKAFSRLKSLSGNKFQFYTGISAINTDSGRMISRVVKTEAFMRNLQDEEISRYLGEDPHFNTYALGFDPLGHCSSAFIRKIEGSYNNLLRGIPLEELVELLLEAGYK